MNKHLKHALLAIAAVIAIALTGCAKKAAHYGPAFTDAAKVQIQQLLNTPDTFYRTPLRVSGQIERQCPSSGCWLFLRDNLGNSIRVELGDSFPKLPLHLGDYAEVEGEWIPKGDKYEFIGTSIRFSKEDPS